MFLTCDGTLGIVPATMDYNGDARPGDFHAGYQEIEGINLGYLQINGTQMFALAQVLSDLFKDIPRTTISKKMETLKIKSRRCDLQELRTLKAIHSVPTRAVKCSLISKADLEALCTSCKSLGPGRRKRKSKRREQLLLPGPGELFQCPRPPLLAACCGPEPGIRSKLAPDFAKAPGGLLAEPFFPSKKGYSLEGPGGLFAGVLSAYPRDLQLLRPAAREQAAPHAEPGRRRRGPCCAKGLFAEDKGPEAARRGRSSAAFPGGKRQGTSAGYSSDSDSSLDLGGSSPGSSSDSSEEEEEEEEEEDTSCSSEEGSSSESESSSLCSGDSVQSTRYRQAALPRFQPAREPGPEEPRAPEPPPKALRPDPNLLLLSQQLWARTLRASTLESWRPEPGAKREAAPPAPPPPSCPGGDPPPGPGGCGGGEPGARPGDLHKDASDHAASPGPRGQVPAPAPAPAGRAASPQPAPQSPGRESAGPGGLRSPEPGEPRREHFDRLIRQSKLWCYAKGFNLDGKSLRPGGRLEPGRAGAELKAPGSKRPASPGPLAGKALRGAGSERHCKRRRLARAAEADRPTSSAKGRPQRAARKARAHCRLPPGRQAFSLLGNFPCVPSLVVGEDGDLRPAASLGGKDSWALSKIHPLWSWQLGGNAMPVPPSLKFRGYSLEDF